MGFAADVSMIKSMTGFGRSENIRDEHRLTVEMKTVNHRYLDLNIKMPKKFNAYEAEIRNILKGYLQRGKVDLFISYEDFSGKNVNVKYNPLLAAEYMKYLSKMAEEFRIPNDVTTSILSRYPEVFTMEETEDEPDEALSEMIRQGLKEACECLVAARSREGDTLKKDLLEKLDSMLESVAFIEERSPQIVAEYKEKLRKRMEELLEGSQADENRLLTEVVIFADRICVDEEIVRLKSHIENMKEILAEGGNVGRKLDFMTQEMNREANTILSKSNDLKISNCGVDLKTNIEKIREQVQNIE